ncbi:extracellular serine/threonine protein CG31145-like [Contarinia nasturtii]|uniref:extracellular serine/threonine protein CG31145-like n=1 Tax=Contarinia nasturtii TaxID=265458 RepID=UPI0012D4BA38|nr:extracellular serine/threonine protein CG31145-like [Contarinia nasturtii]
MRKLFHRPAVAFAAALTIVFLIILLKTYFRLIDLQVPVLIEKPIEVTLDSLERGQHKQSVIVEGPQLPNRISSIAVPKTIITFGTFEALAGNCFLRDDVEYESYFNNFDEFDDLQDVVNNLENRVTQDDEKCDTLGDLFNLTEATSSEDASQRKFYSEISRYRLYSNKSEAVEDLLYDMKTQGISRVDETEGGTQFKLTVTFDNGVMALFKPMRVSREQEALPNQMYFAEYERHTSEIAAYHLDKVLGFRRAMPVIGRKINLITEVLRLAKPNLQRTFAISPKPDENICFTGNCKQFCDTYHPICGNGTDLEGSFMAYFPYMTGTDRMTRSHPWAQSYSKDAKAPWEIDPKYCQKVTELELFSQGRLLLELIDLSIFDFLIGNMDRHNYQRFKAFGEDTFVLRYDHGRAFGKAFHDEFKILAPMLQCCMIKSTTLETLLSIHNSSVPLSERMRKSMEEDPLSPILWEPHLEALDRRLMIILQAVRGCLSKSSQEKVIIPTDNIRFA